MMTTRPSLFGLLFFISFLFSIGVSGAVIPERRADNNPSENNNDDCDTEPEPKIDWRGDTCTDAHKKVIIEEFKTAIEMTDQAQADLHKNNYDATFFSENIRKQKDYKANALGTYKRIGQMLKGTSDYKFQVTCNNEEPSCRVKKGQPQLQAFMKDTPKWKQGDKGTMNFCAAFFDEKPKEGQPSILSTKKRVSECKNDKSDKFTIREAQRSRAGALIHESIHTRYAMRDDQTKKDVKV